MECASNLGTSPTRSIDLPDARSEGFSAFLEAAGEPSRVSTRFYRLIEMVTHRPGERVLSTAGFVKRKDAKIWRPLVVQLDRRPGREGNGPICALCDCCVSLGPLGLYKPL